MLAPSCITFISLTLSCLICKMGEKENFPALQVVGMTESEPVKTKHVGPASAKCLMSKLSAVHLSRREVMGLMVSEREVQGECPAADLHRGPGEGQGVSPRDSYCVSWIPPSPPIPEAHTSSGAASSCLSTPRYQRWSVGVGGGEGGQLTPSLHWCSQSTDCQRTQHFLRGVSKPNPTHTVCQAQLLFRVGAVVPQFYRAQRLTQTLPANKC